ncbi:CCR4-NOT transcription complex subunit 7 [Wyeomyia smithii]|uniref:CCR4-NOT transcription complex subunit 7 n=1 Tax=Wyeomyia smithii TaxID=174621 RepID=UPI00246812DE|nr:CCR4-NOT transcription complex subunit 7 [Wyeomyia smithii]XP_055538860.1 CCR4-NOT transcription complex subunit 7 [Wyeomyia smithii]XP_055538861.1 CCR4-NOT transcription complex subunit 7 [Wyeomyia smithii]
MPSAVSGGGGGNHTGGGGGGGGGNGNNMSTQSNEECGIRDVWRHNLDEEFRTIRHIVQKYHYVAMDTEFPGVVARPVGEFRSSADYQYQFLRCNVDLLRIIQLGLTFMDEEGRTPTGFSTWQFNFKFNLNEDMYAQDSIDLLQNSGIQFKKHEEDGIDPLDFAELLMTSGIVLMDNIKWLSFHSGYDFGYLLKLLTDQNLPAEESDFFELLRIYFPTIYDVKYLMKSCKSLKGGLQEVADQLELRRIGPQHQAGSDSLLTGMAFFKMREMFFEDNIDNAKYCGHLYGLGTSFIVNGSSNTINSSVNNTTSTTLGTSTTTNSGSNVGTTGSGNAAGTGTNNSNVNTASNNSNNNSNNNNTNSSSAANYHDNGETNTTS